MAHKIFIIDDDKLLVKMISHALLLGKYEPVSFYRGKPVLEHVKKEKPYLMLVDINLPDMNGFNLCKTIKNDKELSKIPIIIMSGDSVEIQDRVKGLDMGADDYLIKPFDHHELLARIEAVSRRVYDKKNCSKYIRAGNLCINLEDKTVYRDNEEVQCSKLEYDCLYFLIHRPGKVVGKMELAEYIWRDYERSDERTRTLDRLVSRLRMKLGESGFKLLQTVYGEGYRISPE